MVHYLWQQRKRWTNFAVVSPCHIQLKLEHKVEGEGGGGGVEDGYGNLKHPLSISSSRSVLSLSPRSGVSGSNNINLAQHCNWNFMRQKPRNVQRHFPRLFPALKILSPVVMILIFQI